ncbi:MAG: Ig-like domain repeat protein, partial [Xanthomonadales bacterium]|nr:Ig-like domain repeat protein [Xanthomonadales bacterium]
LILDVTAMGWSGAKVCRSVEFEGDTKVDAELVSSQSAFQLDDGRTHVIDPTGEEPYREIGFNFRLAESVSFEVRLWRLGAEPQLVTRFDAGAEPAFGWRWNGRLADGSVAHSGDVVLRFSLTDGCGHQLELKSEPFLIDSDPPVIEVAAPAAAATMDGMIVPIRYSVFDRTPGEIRVEALLDQGIGLATTPFPQRSQEQYRIDWNRRDHSGPALLRFTARDALGRVSVAEVPITLSQRPWILVAEASVMPLLFSPNGDGRLDATALHYALTEAATVSLRLRSEDGALLATLMNAEPRPAGSYQFDWNGSAAPPDDGVYLLELEATSLSDLSRSELAPLVVEIDRTAAVLELLHPTGEWSNGQGMLQLIVDEPHPALTRWIVGSASGQTNAVGVHELLELEALEEATHTLEVTSDDAVGNHRAFAHTFTVDRTAPLAEILRPASDEILGAQSDFSIIGSASDSHFASATVTLRAAGGDPQTLAAIAQPVDAATLAVLPTVLADGEYLINLSVADLAGNVASAERTIVVDKTPPTLVVEAPVDGANAGSRLVVRGSVYDEHLRDYRLRIATRAMAELEQFTDMAVAEAAVDSGVLFDLPFDLADGEYVIELVAFDLAGQQSSLRRRLMHDRVTPPAPDPLTAELVGNDVLLNWGASIAADLAGYRVYRDGSERSTVAATRLQWTDAAVPEGRLRYHVVAFDAAGNESAPSVPAIVTVDRTPPVVSIGAPRSDETVSGVVVVSGSVRSNEDLSGYRVHAEGPLPSTTRTLLASSDRDVVAGELARWDTSSFAEAQSYRIVLEAEDRVGNAATASVEVTIDQTAPAAPTGLAVSASGSDALLTWNANSESDLLGYVLLRGGNPVNGSGGFPPDLRVLAIAEPHWSDPRLPDGRHEWRVHAIDHAGNLSPGSDPVDWTFANRAPVIRIVAPANATEFADALAIVAESDDGDVVEVRFSQRAAAAATWTAIGVPLAAAPFRTSWDTAGLPYGEYVIRADARDAQGLDALPAQIVVHKVDREPPDQVQQLAARAHGGDVDLTWQAVANGDLHHYRIERHACTACDEWVAVADVPAGSEHHIDPARADGSQEYRVVAVDAFANDAPPSLSARAVVFTIELTPPFTPTRQAGVDLLLRSPRDGESAGQQITPDSSLSLPNLGVSANQPMRYAAIPLFLGANRFEIEVVDADGNRSRKAIASVVRGDAPAPPQGLALAVADHDVTATWLANAEANVVGYRLWHRDQALPAEAVVDGITTTAASGQHGEHASDGNASTGWLRGHTFEPDDEIESFVLDVALVERRWLSGISLSWADGNAPARYRIEAVYDHGVATLATISSPDQPHHAAAFAAPPYVQRLRVVLEALTGPQQYLSLAELVVHQSPLLPLPTHVLNVMDGTHPFHVTAVNNLGFESAPSDVATIAVGDTVAPDPVVLSAVASGAQAQLSWTPSPAPDVARYRIVRDGEVRDEVDASITEYSDGPRPNGVDRYRVLAIDVVGNVGAPSNEVELSFTELLPVAPEGLVVVAVDDRGVMQLVWRAGIGGATPVAYDVERADAVDGPWGAIGSASDTEYEDGDVELGRTYWYRVVALDAAGNRSVPSATASGRLEGVPVPMIFAPALGESAIEIRGERIVAAGTAWPGSTVSVRNHGVFAGEARTAGGDQRRSLVHSIAPGTLRAAPGGGWVDVAATAVAVPLPEAEGVPVGASAPVDLSAYGTIVGWTHDDLVVLLAPDGRTLDVRQLPSQQQRAALPLPFATEAVVVDAKLEYAIARPSGAADRLLRLDDSSGWSSALPGGRVDLASVTFEETLGVVGFRSEDGRLWRVDLGSNTTRQLDSGMGATRLAI